MELDPKLELSIRMGLTSAEHMNKIVLFPEVRTFNELFHAGRVIKDLNGSYRSHYMVEWDLDGGGSCALDSFCTVSGAVRIWLDVKSHSIVDDTIEQHMILSDRYVFNFAIVVRGDGTALVTVKYNLILGDRWLAIIDASTIPGYAEAMAELIAEAVADRDAEEALDVEEPALLELYGVSVHDE